jgi:hypothetical protein
VIFRAGKVYFCQQTTENMDIETREIAIRNLRPNSGEVEGLPRNPRKISKKQLEKLKKIIAGRARDAAPA